MKRIRPEFADEFDRKLYGLIGSAEAQEHPKWTEIARELGAVRPKVRGFMDPKRRAETVG